MNFSNFLAGLRARYRVFLWIVPVTVLAALVVSLLTPKTYVARASIISDGKIEQSLAPGPQYYNERERASYLQTQVDILTSPKVARRVVDDLALSKDSGLRAAFDKAQVAGSFEDWLGQQLLTGLKVDTSQSSIIKLTYASDDPVQAALLANAFARAYVESVLELRVEPLKKASAWFDEQLKELRASMEAAEGRLNAFQREHGILAADERNDLEIIRLTELANLAARTREPAGYDSYVAAAVRDSRSIDHLKTSLSVAKAKMQELTGEFGNRHPKVLRQSAEVEALEAQLDSEMKQAAAHAERGLRAARQHSQELRADVAAQRKRVGDLREAHTRLAILRNDFANAQRTYDQALQRSMASTIDSRALMPNVSVLSEATPPSGAQRPKPMLNLMLALVMGVLISLAAVYFLELSDRRLRGVDDLLGDPRLPLLVVLNDDSPTSIRLLANHAAGAAPAFQRAITGPR
jgi:polysaccharide biosynthesis transport protein